MNLYGIEFPVFGFNGFIDFSSPGCMEMRVQFIFPEWNQNIQSLVFNNIKLCYDLQKAMFPIFMIVPERKKDHMKLIYSDGKYLGN